MKTIALIIISVFVLVLVVLFFAMVIQDERQIAKFKKNVDKELGDDFDWDQML